MTRTRGRNNEVIVLERPLDLVEDLGADHLVVMEVDISALVGILHLIDKFVGQIVCVVA